MCLPFTRISAHISILRPCRMPVTPALSPRRGGILCPKTKSARRNDSELKNGSLSLRWLLSLNTKWLCFDSKQAAASSARTYTRTVCAFMLWGWLVSCSSELYGWDWPSQSCCYCVSGSGGFSCETVHNCKWPMRWPALNSVLAIVCLCVCSERGNDDASRL